MVIKLSQPHHIFKPIQTRTAGRRAFSPIGLDLGSSQIKLMQLQRKNGVVSIYRCASFPSPAGRDGDLADTIQRALKEAGCRGRRVVASLHGQAAILRRITLPPLSPPEVSRAMRWEAEKQLPLPAEEFVYDYAFLEKRNFRGKTVLDFILAAVPRSVAENCTEAVLKAGYFPEAIEAAPLALRRAVHWCGSHNLPPCNGTVLVIHVGRENSDLLVLHRGRHRFYRPVNVGINHFCKEAAKSSKLSPAEAECCLFSTAPLQHRGLGAAVSKLARQAARSLEFYTLETEFPEKHCEAVLLCGGGALIPGLEERLSSELGLPVSRFNPFAASCFPDGPGNGFESGPLYSIALGLALRGWAG